GALLVFTERAVGVIDSLILRVVPKVRAGDEKGLAERIPIVAGALHLEEIFLGEEPAVRQQAFVNGAQLGNAELRVGDAAAPGVASSARAGKGEQLEHTLEHVIAEADAVEQRR